MNVWSETSLYRKGRSEISWKKPLLESVQIEHFSSNCRLAVKCELSGMLFWIKDTIYIYILESVHFEDTNLHTYAYLLLAHVKHRLAWPSCLNLKRFFVHAVHAHETRIYIYIYIHSSSRPSLSFVLPGLCKVLICCMGWSQRFGGMTTTMICSRCIFFEVYIHIYWVGTSGVDSARSVYNIYIYIHLLCVIRIRQKARSQQRNDSGIALVSRLAHIL